MLRFQRFATGGYGCLLFVFLVLAASCLAGCDEEDAFLAVTAVRPFYTPQDLTTDGALAGTWSYEDEVTFVFTPNDDSTYNVVVEEAEGDKHFTSHFEGHLFRLGPDYFLDLYPTSVPEGSEFYFLHFFRCHTATKIDFPGDRLEMRFLSPFWLATQIKAGAVSIEHAKSQEILLLTATTQQMQELLYLNANDDDAFPEPIVFERGRDEEAQ